MSNYQKLKASPFCVRCKKELKVEGRTMCVGCAEKAKLTSRENREFFKERKICYRCGKNKLFGDEKICPECLARANEINRKYAKKHREYYHIKNAELKANGMCRSCAKRKVETGKTYCSICLAKRRERAKQLNAKKGINVRELRRYLGKCYICGIDVDIPESTICSKCRERCIQNLKKSNYARAKHWWKKDNKSLEGKKKNEQTAKICKEYA